ncbi:TIGR04063 family PEP-CTERM/XrtA system glycosyltransferase [Aromatoleum aromaticum]|uniref:Glycosyl transferase, group 1 n=1 Tax=Aromatoleum aromaticum (strain DSM 19018 / LMG 30748 / EbN1) TaxID=76114 RepID=Q5P2C6_AROAE|nr:TIGR04063 family PEP-CTERM/XrtA system glycosyltransferase [Aromatoleum aromaticum]NMG54670.1 glycosyltransferase, exosortase A system-associated [Aromatoleum aromaticum]CAI08538.1 Glycosyl transferase, group 1 [Aromatoleum aromaticum EbN1]
MRILHVLDHSLPLHSGYTFRTAAIVREQRALGWETFHLTTPKQGKSTGLVEDADGLSFHRTPAPDEAGLLAQMRFTAARLDELVRALQPDVIHAHSPVLNALPSLWVARRRKLPVVYELRASWEDAAVDHGTTTEGSLRYRLSRALESFALHHADQVTTICEGLRGDIASRGIAADKITVIPNAVDAGAFKFGTEPDAALRTELGLDGKTVIGFAGSFYGYEGLHLLVSALARLVGRFPEIRLLLVGGGVQEEALRRQAVAEGIADRVVFTGRVAHNRVQKYYELIDVLAYPRLPMRLTELVTPLKPLEAMAQGRMFVASDVGGHRELVRDGETGFLCKAGSVDALADTIASVLGNREAWPGMRANARAFVERERTWANSVGRYQDVYQRALATRGREALLAGAR